MSGINATIGDLGKVLGRTVQNLDPESFNSPDTFVICGNKVYLKFDELAIFYSPAAGGMVLAYSLNGKQVLWEPCPIPGFKGELVIANLVGWQALDVK